MTDEPEFYTFAEACALLRISTSAGYRAVSAGTFPLTVIRITPRRLIVPRDALSRIAQAAPVPSVAS